MIHRSWISNTNIICQSVLWKISGIHRNTKLSHMKSLSWAIGTTPQITISDRPVVKDGNTKPGQSHRVISSDTWSVWHPSKINSAAPTHLFDRQTWKCLVFPGVAPTPTRLPLPCVLDKAPITTLIRELFPGGKIKPSGQNLHYKSTKPQQYTDQNILIQSVT